MPPLEGEAEEPAERLEAGRSLDQEFVGAFPDALQRDVEIPIAAQYDQRHAGGRSLLVPADSESAEFATLNMPEFGAVAVVLAAADWAMPPARSPYLDVLDAMVGGVVVPRTDALAIERRPEGIAISSVAASPRT